MDYKGFHLDFVSLGQVILAVATLLGAYKGYSKKQEKNNAERKDDKQAQKPDP